MNNPQPGNFAVFMGYGRAEWYRERKTEILAGAG